MMPFGYGGCPIPPEATAKAVKAATPHPFKHYWRCADRDCDCRWRDVAEADTCWACGGPGKLAYGHSTTDAQ